MLSRKILVVSCFGICSLNLPAARNPDESPIREILRAQTEAWNRGDGAAWAKVFTDDCDFVNMRGTARHGRSEIESDIASSLQGRMKGTHLSLVIRQFNWLSPNVVLIETDYEITGLQGELPGIAPTAEGILKTRLKYVAVRRDKNWQFVAAQNTPVLPPARKR